MRRTTGAALAAFAIGAAGLLLATPAAADGPTTFTNSAAILIITDIPAPPTPATPYPSTITVSGMTGPVSDVDVRLTGFTHSTANDVDLLLVGPSGANVVLLSDPGDPGAAVSANLATVTFDDSAATGVPQVGNITGTVSYRPTDNDPGGAADSFPSPAPAPSSATTLGTFTGTNPNGTWSLYVVDDAAGDSGSIAGGWSVTITTSAAASTTTTVTSSANPSTFGQAVTFTATVTSGASPVTTGTVTFSEGAVTLAGPLPLNGSGQATFSTSALAEASHTITATYSGTVALLTSSGSVTQVVDHATTTPDGDTWCNSGGITVPAFGAGTPYPSHITVSGAGTAISTLTVDLADVSHTVPVDLDVLLVGPAGSNLVLMSDVGGFAAASNVDLTFADSAGGPIPAAGPLSTGTFDPSDDDSGGLDAGMPAPAPAASTATTLATFNGTNPNGTWSLFVVDDASGDSGSIAGGWCLNVSTAQPTTTTLTSSVNPSTVGQAVTFTATVTSGGNPVTTGTVTFTEGAATLAASVVLNGSGQATFSTSAFAEGSHTITATYSGTAGFQPSSGSVTQLVQNAAPACADDAGSTAEDVQLADSLGCTDPGDSLTYAEVAGPSNGSLLLNADGSFTYDPDPDFNGTDSFTFTANDGTVDSNVATYTVAVGMTNDAPVLGPIGAQTATEGSTVGFIATASDIDLPPDTLTFSLVGGPSGSTIDPQSGVFSWFAPNDGISTFDVCVSDGSLSDCEPVTVTVTNVAPSGGTLPNTAMPAQLNTDVVPWIVGAVLISCLALLAGGSGARMQRARARSRAPRCR